MILSYAAGVFSWCSFVVHSLALVWEEALGDGSRGSVLECVWLLWLFVGVRFKVGSVWFVAIGSVSMVEEWRRWRS